MYNIKLGATARTLVSEEMKPNQNLKTKLSTSYFLLFTAKLSYGQLVCLLQKCLQQRCLCEDATVKIPGYREGDASKFLTSPVLIC